MAYWYNYLGKKEDSVYYENNTQCFFEFTSMSLRSKKEEQFAHVDDTNGEYSFYHCNQIYGYELLDGALYNRLIQFGLHRDPCFIKGFPETVQDGYSMAERIYKALLSTFDLGKIKELRTHILFSDISRARDAAHTWFVRTCRPTKVKLYCFDLSSNTCTCRTADKIGG